MVRWIETLFGLLKFLSLVAVVICGVYHLFTIEPILGITSGILVGTTFKYDKKGA